MERDLLDTPFTSHDLSRYGLTRQRLRDRVADGRIRRVLTNVYVRGDAPDTIELRLAAVALVLPEFGVVCDRTAAWLHGVDVLDYRELEMLPPLDVFVIRDYRARRRGEVRSGQRDLDPLDVMKLEGVLVTTPLRTALDLGCGLPRQLALATLDQFIGKHYLTIEDMQAELPRYWRRRGVVQLRRLILLADGRSESPGESMTRLALIEAGLPVPYPQYSIQVGGRELYRLDLAYPNHRVCIEYDGELFHSTPKQRAADEARRAWLRAHGWTVIIVRKGDLDRESVRAWTTAVREALRG
jgi:hypothetical protein